MGVQALFQGLQVVAECTRDVPEGLKGFQEVSIVLSGVLRGAPGKTRGFRDDLGTSQGRSICFQGAFQEISGAFRSQMNVFKRLETL